MGYLSRNPASLWLLHWKLLEAPCEATTWYFVFNVLNRAEFTDRKLLEELEDFGDLYLVKQRYLPQKRCELFTQNVCQTIKS
ncbi:DUF4007 family protein (plasmid) [Picosynechococcus sp. PCC 11901]|uniref:DUF4007 family protein n=1 Tax=Picosynechococcus sp. PCC 11901 TaxID=2579791 RepID=UPI0010FBF05C|nr:DUF4007 family protein [Picosynechococcus sp. PCC 11901]QCS48136.1 DUF4007 family protein [Picosynechococcus sp. PCC 11901]